MTVSTRLDVHGCARNRAPKGGGASIVVAGLVFPDRGGATAGLSWAKGQLPLTKTRTTDDFPHMHESSIDRRNFRRSQERETDHQTVRNAVRFITTTTHPTKYVLAGGPATARELPCLLSALPPASGCVVVV